MTRYSIIHKDGTETAYVWCDKTKQMVVYIEMKTAVIYSNGSQECERMGMLLQDLKNIDEYLEYRLDKHFSEKAFIDEFGEEATFPQIAIGNKHIGGMKEALRYMSDKGMFL